MSLGFLPLAEEGRRLLLREAGFALVFGGALYFAAPRLLGALGLLFTAIACFTLFFFREPRFMPGEVGEAMITAPSYGTVLKTGLEDGRPVVRIFLSVLDVHAQYSPVAGTVKKVAVYGDNFAAAYRDEASGNRRNLIEIVMKNNETLGVEQIAGSIARRISCPLKAGDALLPGGRLGLIYFGSQVAVYLPPGAEIQARPGERVYPCRTPLARLKASA